MNPPTPHTDNRHNTGHHDHTRRPRHRFELGALGLLAAFTTVLFAGWLWESVSVASARAVVQDLRGGEQVERERIVSAIADLERFTPGYARGTHDHWRAYLRLAELAAIPARDLVPAHGRARLAVIAEEIDDALAREPARAHAWARRAHVQYRREGPSADMLDSLRMSIYAGPNDPALAPWRVNMALHARDLWDEEYEYMMRSQARVAWHMRPAAVADLILATTAPDQEHASPLYQFVHAALEGRQPPADPAAALTPPSLTAGNDLPGQGQSTAEATDVASGAGADAGQNGATTASPPDLDELLARRARLHRQATP